MSPERRESRSFEPPPWEKAQYEELERVQAEQEGAEEPAPQESQVEQPDTAAEGGTGAQEVAPIAEAARPTAAQAGQETAGAAQKGAIDPSTVPEVRKTGAPEGEVDPARMTELMANLKAEEPSPSSFWKLGLVVAAGMAVLGSVMMIWGIVGLQATRGSGELGWMGAAVLISFGAGFIAVAGWFAYKNLQKQGVL